MARCCCCCGRWLVSRLCGRREHSHDKCTCTERDFAVDRECVCTFWCTQFASACVRLFNDVYVRALYVYIKIINYYSFCCRDVSCREPMQMCVQHIVTPHDTTLDKITCCPYGLCVA